MLVTLWLGAGVSRVRKQNSRDKERLCGNTEGFLTPLNPSLVSSAVRLTRSTCDCLFFPAPEERGCSTVGGGGVVTSQHLPERKLKASQVLPSARIDSELLSIRISIRKPRRSIAELQQQLSSSNLAVLFLINQILATFLASFS